jgi:hypothetical protein
MIDRIQRESAARVATRIVVILAILLVAMLVSQRLSETNALMPDASQPIQGYLVYSGDDIWHAFPTRR